MTARIVETQVRKSHSAYASWECVAILSDGRTIIAQISDATLSSDPKVRKVKKFDLQIVRGDSGRIGPPAMAELQATLRQFPFLWKDSGTGKRVAELPP